VPSFSLLEALLISLSWWANPMAQRGCRKHRLAKGERLFAMEGVVALAVTKSGQGTCLCHPKNISRTNQNAKTDDARTGGANGALLPAL